MSYNIDYEADYRLFYAHDGDAGVDLRSMDYTVIPVKGRRLVSTGLRLNLPNGVEAQIRPRSGLAWEHGITVLNSPGTIDSGYQGVIKVNLINLGNEPFQIQAGDRIAQMVIAKYDHPTFTLNHHDNWEETTRGEKGHGSTGV